MAYATSNPPALLQDRIMGGGAVWSYISADARATVVAWRRRELRCGHHRSSDSGIGNCSKRRYWRCNYHRSGVMKTGPIRRPFNRGC